jgi:hypothetical protein
LVTSSWPLALSTWLLPICWNEWTFLHRHRENQSYIPTCQTGLGQSDCRTTVHCLFLTPVTYLPAILSGSYFAVNTAKLQESTVSLTDIRNTYPKR